MTNKELIIQALQAGKYRHMSEVLNCFCCLYHYTATPCQGGIDCDHGIKLFMEAEVGSIKRK